MIYLNEDTLVQQTTTDYLKSNLGWDEVDGVLQYNKVREGVPGQYFGNFFLLFVTGLSVFFLLGSKCLRKWLEYDKGQAFIMLL